MAPTRVIGPTRAVAVGVRFGSTPTAMMIARAEVLPTSVRRLPKAWLPDHLAVVWIAKRASHAAHEQSSGAIGSIPPESRAE